MFRFEAKRGWCQANIPLAMTLPEAIEMCDAYSALEQECALDASRRAAEDCEGE